MKRFYRFYNPDGGLYIKSLHCMLCILFWLRRLKQSPHFRCLLSIWPCWLKSETSPCTGVMHCKPQGGVEGQYHLEHTKHCQCRSFQGNMGMMEEAMCIFYIWYMHRFYSTLYYTPPSKCKALLQSRWPMQNSKAESRDPCYQLLNRSDQPVRKRFSANKTIQD